MSASSLKKFFLQALVIPGTVFCASTLPLAILGSQDVDITIQNEPVFTGKLRNIAAPYLAIASVFSAGVGVAVVSLNGWKESQEKATKFESELSNVQENLKQKADEIETLKLSETRLQKTGLADFLEAEVSLAGDTVSISDSIKSEANTISQFNQAVHQTSVASVAQEAITHKPLIIYTEHFEAPGNIPKSEQIKSAVSGFAAAQNFLSFHRTEAQTSSHLLQKSADNEVENLQNQLQQITAQLVSIQRELHTKTVTTPNHQLLGNQKMATEKAHPWLRVVEYPTQERKFAT